MPETVYELPRYRHPDRQAAVLCLLPSDWLAQVRPIAEYAEETLSGTVSTSLTRPIRITRVHEGFTSYIGALAAPGWLLDVARQLVRLSQLPPNWDREGSEPLKIGVLTVIPYVLNHLMQQRTPAPAIVPTRRGGVQLEWHERGIDIEVEIDPSGEIHVSVDDAAANVEWEGRFAESRGQLERAIDTLSRP
jgi:hypothetical protein